VATKKVEEREQVVGQAVGEGDNVDPEGFDLSDLFDEDEIPSQNEGEGEEGNESLMPPQGSGEEPAEESDEGGSEGQAGEESSSSSPPPSGELPPLLSGGDEGEESPKELTPEELQAQREQAAKQLEEYFARMMEGSDEFSDPREVLPKVLARSYLDLYGSVMQQVEQQVVPRRVQQQMAVLQEAQRIEMAFYRRWPQLAEAAQDPEKLKVIQRSLRTYRQANPDVPVEQAIEEAGAMAVVALKVPLRKRSGGASSRGGFRPAAPGTSSSAAQGQQAQGSDEDNAFVAMAEEMIEDGEV